MCLMFILYIQHKYTLQNNRITWQGINELYWEKKTNVMPTKQYTFIKPKVKTTCP